jgi:hypothetical protein
MRKLVDYVRDTIRLKYGRGTESFNLAEVYKLAERAAASFPLHASVVARHGVMRRMLQDERRKRGLIFVEDGTYQYPLTLNPISDSQEHPEPERITTMPKNKTQVFEMSREEWFDNEKYPYWPNERDYVKHGKLLLARPDFDPNHPTLGQNCALITVLGLGITFKGNGMTTTNLSKEGKCNYPARVHGVHYYVENMEEGQLVYKGFDNPNSVKGPKDKMVSALKAAGLIASSKAFANGDGMTGLSIAWNAIHGRRANNRPDSDGVETVVRTLRSAFKAVDEILAKAEMHRASKLAKSTPALAAMLLTFLKIHNTTKTHTERVEKISEWQDFWTNFVTSKGMHAGGTHSPFNVLWHRLAEGIKGKGGSRDVTFNWTEKALWVFERRDGKVGDKLGTLNLASYYVMRTRKPRVGSVALIETRKAA